MNVCFNLFYPGRDVVFKCLDVMLCFKYALVGLDPDGVRVRAAQGIDAADYFVPGYWVWAKIIENLGRCNGVMNHLL